MGQHLQGVEGREYLQRNRRTLAPDGRGKAIEEGVARGKNDDILGIRGKTHLILPEDLA